MLEFDGVKVKDPFFLVSGLLLVGAFGVGSSFGNARGHCVIFEGGSGSTGQVAKCWVICWKW